MSQLTIRLFGYPQILVNDIPIKVERKKTMALVTYLAVETGLGRSAETVNDQRAQQGCTRESLAELLWPACSPEQAFAYLRQALRDFDKAAGGEWISRDDPFIALNPQAAIWVDVDRFEDLLAQWKSGGKDDAAAISILDECVDLYQADFLTGFTLRNNFTFDDWQALQAEKFRMHLAQGLDALVNLYAVGGKHDLGETHVRRWLVLDPFNEAAHRAAMRLYAESGQLKAALHQYERCRRLLLDGLGVEPQPETVILSKQLMNRASAPLKAGQDAPAKGDQALKESKRAQEKPTGTVTFLFTDIESSTKLWELQPEAMQHSYARHEAIIREVMAAYQGYVYKMVGDAFQVAFSTAPAALEAALAAQRALNAEPWGETGSLRVRMALHTGITDEREDDYVGPTLNHAARLLNAGHGGQVLLNQTTYELVHEHLPRDVSLGDLGEHSLKDLVNLEHIYQVIAPGLPAEFAPLNTADASRVHLPLQVMDFVGREAELVQIKAMLKDPACRLISLVGIGGIGKTRLAIRAAGGSPDFPHGIYFVDLAPVTNLDDMIHTIANALKLVFFVPQGTRFSPQEAQAQLLSFLAGKRVLLVLDNFEQLVCFAGVVNDLLQAAPGVKLIVTSRERLNLPCEWVLPISGLSFPGSRENDRIPQFAAVQLFVKTAERNWFSSPGPADWQAIAHICRRLEGIPLAVEMAASWVRLFSCQEIASSIETDLDFLTADWRGIPERHRTLRAVFEHSWRLLPDREREVFAQLSAFQGGFTREAALEVASAPLRLLVALADKSLIRRLSSGRFEIHPVLNQYAAEKLATQPAVQADVQGRHAVYYSDWLDRMDEKLKGTEQLGTLSLVRAETQNLLTAYRSLLMQGDFQRLQYSILPLIHFYEMDDQRVQMQEVIRLLGSLISVFGPIPGRSAQPSPVLPPASAYPALRALAAAALCHFINRASYQWEDSIPSLQESLEMARQLPDNQTKAFALILNSTGLRGLSPLLSIEYARQSLVIFENLGNTWGTALANLVLGDADNFGGANTGVAQGAYQAGLELFTRLRSDWGRGMCLIGLADVKRRAGQLENAYQLGRQSLEIFEQMNNQERLLFNRNIMGEIATKIGALEEARDYFEANLVYLSQVGDEASQTYCRERLAALGKPQVERTSSQPDVDNALIP